MFKNMFIKLKSFSLFLLAVAVSFSSLAQAESMEEKIGKKLKKINENIEIDTLVKSPLSGMYEVTLKSGDILFSDANADYLLVGQLFQLDADKGFINLTQQKQEKKVAAQLASYSAEKQIIYSATSEEKATITVFTDITCPYCKKLHQAIPELQEKGVTVKYMAFPRSGAGSRNAKEMGSIWCAKNRNQAMDDAKMKGKIEALNCNDPVDEQFAVGHQIGVNATPTIFTDEGVKIAGFASTGSLLRDLGIN